MRIKPLPVLDADKPLKNISLLATARPAGAGTFRVVYVPAMTSGSAQWEQGLREAQLLEQFAAALNEFLHIPVDLTLALADCDQANALYQPQRRTVTVCYQLLQHFASVFSHSSQEPQKLIELVIGNVQFVLLHEVGHALIDVLQLPVLGREEDAADQIAAWLLASSGTGGRKAVLAVARYFVDSQQPARPGRQLPVWDEHPLDAQRYYNILCWLYGHDSRQYAYLVEDDPLPIPMPLPTSRAHRCTGEVQQFQRSFLHALTPYLKTTGQPVTPPPPPGPPPPGPSPQRTTPPVGSPSFDCTKARLLTEQLICADDELASLDVRMARLYFAALEHTLDKNALKQTQRTWLKVRRDVCPDVACLRRVYHERITELSR